MSKTIGEFFQEEYLKVSQAMKTGKLGGEIKHFLSNPAATEAQATAIVAKLMDEVATAGNDVAVISAGLVADVKAFAALVQAHPDAPQVQKAEGSAQKAEDTRTEAQKLTDAASYDAMQKRNVETLSQPAPATSEAPPAPAPPAAAPEPAPATEPAPADQPAEPAPSAPAGTNTKL